MVLLDVRFNKDVETGDILGTTNTIMVLSKLFRR